MQLFRIVHLGRRAHPFGQSPHDAEKTALVVYCLSSAVSVIMSVFGKLCSQAGVNFLMLTAVRSSVLCLLIVPVLLKHRANPFAITDAFGLLVLRGCCGCFSLLLWYCSMSLLPLSDANALSFVSPVLVSLLAPYILQEATPKAVYFSMPVCLVGMLMVAQPSWIFGSAAGATSQLGVIAGIFQAIFSAGGKLTIRALNKHHEPLECILFSMGIISTFGALIGCLLVPGAQLVQPQGISTYSYLAATSVLAFIVQITFTSSVRKCHAAAAASLDYISLLWTLMADALIFKKLPSTLSICGAALICAASLTALLLGSRKPGEAAGEGEAGSAPPKPLEYKRQHYLGNAAVAGCHPRLVVRDSSSSRDEALPLVVAAKAALVAVAAAAAAGGADISALLSSAMATKQAATGGMPGAGAPAAGSPDGDKCAAKRELVESMTDSSKSWKLGTEVAEAVKPDAAERPMGAEQLPSISAAGCQAGEAGEADGGDAAAASNGSQLPLCIQLVSVSVGPGAMRTSSEKERALQAAGK